MQGSLPNRGNGKETNGRRRKARDREKEVTSEDGSGRERNAWFNDW